MTPDGAVAAFTSAAPIDGSFDNADRYEVYRNEVGGPLRCISCNPTEVPPSTDASLASDGSSLADDGRVFFNSGEPLVLRDANNRKDVYEWSNAAGRAELISTGGGQFDSSLLGVSSDGTDAFFFSRETLASNDGNGNLVKLYDAREGGGFFTIPPPPACVASDECHGPGSPTPPPTTCGTCGGRGGNLPKGHRRRHRHKHKKHHRGQRRTHR